MMQADGKRSFGKAPFVLGYAAIIGVYAMIGANALQAIFPNFSFVLLAGAGALVLMKLDYIFNGPAFSLERKFVKRFPKRSRVNAEEIKSTEVNISETKE